MTGKRAVFRDPRTVSDGDTCLAHTQPYFLLRAPALPISELLSWAEAATHGCGTHWLTSLVRRAEVRDAITFASPSLGRALDAWLEQPDMHPRTTLSVSRYVLRMLGRSTPFGLLAGTAVGTFAKRRNLHIGDADQHRVYARVDSTCLSSILRHIADDPGARHHSLLEPNSTLYRIANEYRFVEFHSSHDVVNFSRSAAAADGPLEMILALSRGGKMASELVARLTADGYSSIDATAYVSTLIDEQILLPTFLIPPLDETAAESVLMELQSVAPTHTLTTALATLTECASDANLHPTRDAVRLLANTLSTVGADVSQDIQLDYNLQLRFAGTFELDSLIQHEIEQAASALMRIERGAPTSPAAAVAAELEGFRRRFSDHFGDAIVPLAHALDPDAGVGYGGADITPPPSRQPDVSQMWSQRLADLTFAGLEDHLHEIVLSATDIREMESHREKRWPANLLMSVRIGSSAIHSHDILMSVAGFGGASTPRALGRFANGDCTLADHIRQAALMDAGHDDGIDAELLFSPCGKLGNIAARPPIAPHEIWLLGRGSAPVDRRLFFADLLVTVIGDQVVLYNCNGTPIRVHLTCAHAGWHSSLPPSYRFLYALAQQGRDAVLAWDWGMLRALPHLPRIRYGRTLLSLERWRLSDKHRAVLTSAPIRARHAAIQHCRRDLGLPRFVAVLENDEDLVFDLDNPALADTLVQSLPKVGPTDLVEVFPHPERSLVRRREQLFMHDLMVPLINDAAQRVPLLKCTHPEQCRELVLPPGSEWLYLKLFAGPRDIDTLLIEHVARWIDGFRRRQLIDDWFFVRYDDPRHHLRLRLHGNPDVVLSRIFPEIATFALPLVTAGVINSLGLDTYRPEVRRYGGLSYVRPIEWLFARDSDAALIALRAALEYGHIGDPDARVIIACQSVYAWLQVLYPDVDGRLATLTRLANRFMAEFYPDGSSARMKRRALAKTYRVQKHTLEEALTDPARHPSFAPMADAFTRLANEVRPAIASLRAEAMAGKMTCTFDSLADSILHMSLNRLLPNEPRRHELIVYDSLAQLCRSMMARSKTSAVAAPLSAGGSPSTPDSVTRTFDR